MTRVRLYVEVDVFDEDVLRKYAQKRYQQCWGEDIPDPLGTAVFEALIGSNEGPSPNEIGVCIADYGEE